MVKELSEFVEQLTIGVIEKNLTTALNDKKSCYQ